MNLGKFTQVAGIEMRMREASGWTLSKARKQCLEKKESLGTLQTAEEGTPTSPPGTKLQSAGDLSLRRRGSVRRGICVTQ